MGRVIVGTNCNDERSTRRGHINRYLEIASPSMLENALRSFWCSSLVLKCEWVVKKNNNLVDSLIPNGTIHLNTQSTECVYAKQIVKFRGTCTCNLKLYFNFNKNVCGDMLVVMFFLSFNFIKHMFSQHLPLSISSSKADFEHP